MGAIDAAASMAAEEAMMAQEQEMNVQNMAMSTQNSEINNRSATMTGMQNNTAQTQAGELAGQREVGQAAAHIVA